MGLYMQLEQLQQEVLSLRGQVEELTYRQRRMETEQRDRYLDLDQRISTLGGGAPVEPGAGGAALPGGQGNFGLDSGLDAGTAGAANAPEGQDPAAISDAIPPTAENEQQIYRQALSFLLEENRYDESISLFQTYIDNYPDGRYLTNAYYWQGEALLLVGRNADAEAAFKTVVDDYPADPKAAGAMLKLGVAYRELGEEAQARETWQRVRDEYPSSLTEISAAEDYLNRLGPQ